MRYVAFDVESSDGCFVDGNLCEFGYVIADENFNIIKQDDILVRPIHNNFSASFHISLSFPIKEYKKAPPFASSYKDIADVFAGEDVIVVGHAIHNDIVCVNNACRNIDKKCFDFKYIDSQLIYKAYTDNPNVVGLEKIAEDIEEEFTAHRADEDARMSLCTLKYVLKKKKMTLSQLMEDTEATFGTNIDGDIKGFSLRGGCTTPSLNSKNSKRRILSMFEPERGEIEDKSHPLYKAKIYLDSDYILQDIDVTRALLQKISDVGGVYVKNPTEAKYLVEYTGNMENLNGQLVTYEDIVSMLGGINIHEYDDEKILKDYLELKRKKREFDKGHSPQNKGKNRQYTAKYLDK